MPLSRAIVWMDSREARVFRFGADDLERDQLRADRPFLRVNHRAGAMRAGRPAADLDFLDRVIDSLRGTHLWCLAGPDSTKNELVGYLDKYKDRDGHIAQLRLQLLDISSMDPPTDGDLIRQARQAVHAPAETS
jgi:hypothetical protein